MKSTKIGVLSGATLALFLGSAGMARAEEQPQMRDALESLHAAEHHLQDAEHHSKGGHREKELKLVESAIQQVEAGIAYDNAHPDKNDKGDKDDAHRAPAPVLPPAPPPKTR